MRACRTRSGRAAAGVAWCGRGCFAVSIASIPRSATDRPGLLDMAPGDTAVSILIGALADGPRPPMSANSSWPNRLHTRVADLVATMGPPPWSKRIIADERQLVTLIASPSGGGNRPHWHRELAAGGGVPAGMLEREPTGGTGFTAPTDA